MYTGKLKAPKNISANAMLTTRNKYFLRIFLFFAKITMVSKFPTTTRINVSVKALHNAMPFTWVPSYASFVSFSRLTPAEDDEDVLFILWWYWDNDEEARVQHLFCASLLFTDQSRMQALHWLWHLIDDRDRPLSCEGGSLFLFVNLIKMMHVLTCTCSCHLKCLFTLSAVLVCAFWLVSHCYIDKELSPLFVYPANRPCVWISPYGTDKGAAYGKKLLKTVLISVRCRTRSLPFKLFKSLLKKKKKNLDFNEQRFNLS